MSTSLEPPFYLVRSFPSQTLSSYVDFEEPNVSETLLRSFDLGSSMALALELHQQKQLLPHHRLRLLAEPCSRQYFPIISHYPMEIVHKLILLVFLGSTNSTPSVNL